MKLLGGFIVPHPPIIIPDIGRGEEKKLKKTVDAYQRISKKIAELKPSTIIFITPHHVMYRDYFHISPGDHTNGTLDQFRSNEHFMVDYRSEFVKVFKEKFPDYPAGGMGATTTELDHGVMIPLHFIQSEYQAFKTVRVSLSGLSLDEHLSFGKKIKKTMDVLGDSYVVVASGDLSHKLLDSGPYGYIKEGPIFDDKITKLMKDGDFKAMTQIKTSLYQKAAECGLRSFVILGGILDGEVYDSKLHSYEGPFGVGYAVASYLIKDPYVWLAKQTIKEKLENSTTLKKPKNLPQDLLNHQAGVFVSLKKAGRLRGCIGTIRPTTDSIADEIIQNAISAAFNDPRFDALEASELNDLTISVDILKEAERIHTFKDLDVKRYGVIVKSGYRSGLLLPNLEGVTSIEEQVQIALSKAGIYPDESYDLYRFEVIRHQ